jgi:hypothetical protein
LKTKHIFLGAQRVCSVAQEGVSSRKVLYYHPDHLGSSNVITNQQGQPLQYAEYTPFGGFARDERLTHNARRISSPERSLAVFFNCNFSN